MDHPTPEPALIAEYVAVRSHLTEAENAQVTDQDIAGAAGVFISRPNPRMVANRIAVLLRGPARTDGQDA